MRGRPLALTMAGLLGFSLVLLTEPEAAEADPAPPTCSDEIDSCEVEITIPGADGGGEADPGTDSGDGPPAGGGSDTDALTDCSSTMLEDADSHPLAGPRPNDRSVLIIETCTTETGSSIQSAEWVELGADGQMQFSPELLAQRAVDRLRLPQPQIAASPEDYQLVRLPTWLWLDGDSWSAQSASASVPGLTVTATATPVKATWDLGDGTTVECGAGTAWTSQYDAEAPSPDCGHTYTRSSAHVPDGEYEVSVTVEWAVSWAGGGQTGTEPAMTTTAQVSWQVAESQATVQ